MVGIFCLDGICIFVINVVFVFVLDKMDFDIKVKKNVEFMFLLISRFLIKLEYNNYEYYLYILGIIKLKWFMCWL